MIYPENDPPSSKIFPHPRYSLRYFAFQSIAMGSECLEEYLVMATLRGLDPYTTIVSLLLEPSGL